MQRDRLTLSDWLQKLSADSDSAEPVALLSDGGKHKIDKLTDVWGDLPNVILAEEWRERALVPSEWLGEE